MHPERARSHRTVSERTVPTLRETDLGDIDARGGSPGGDLTGDGEPGADGMADLDRVAYSVRDARVRQRCELVGTVVTLGTAPGRLVALDLVLDDGTGRVWCHFTGRHALPGVVGGTRMRVSGTLGTRGSTPCLLNPAYELLGTEDGTGASS